MARWPTHTSTWSSPAAATAENAASAFDTDQLKPYLEFERVLQDGVFAAVRYRGVGKGSGVEVEQTHYWAQTYVAERLHRFVVATEREEAERELGI